MYKKIMIGVVSYIVILLIIFAVKTSYGVELDYVTIDMMTSSNLYDGEKATCKEYHTEVLSHVELLDEFLETCEINTEFDYDSDFFREKVLVVYYYNGTISKKPHGFYDYFWSTDGYEIIKTKKKWTPFLTKSDVYHIYLIEMEKEEIIGSDILFD